VSLIQICKDPCFGIWPIFIPQIFIRGINICRYPQIFTDTDRLQIACCGGCDY